MQTDFEGEVLDPARTIEHLEHALQNDKY